MRRFDNNTTGVNWLEDDCIIRARTIHRFRDQEFASRIIPMFNKILRFKNISIIKFNRCNNEIGYNVLLGENKEVMLFYTYSDLCSICGM
ncbi:hypothetical protein LL037_21230 [Clostridium estertheticum]|uniref:hypothetical protein n=1 Tax=Clostridium estertheticum TaxID=238834 RepID=UPI001C0D6B68|nr:hypothetical protein [Clostridium estertheticum]MBU3198268.1 hypothetical protein [Clostridium estertheticum]MCB2354406.1 hypothetical protein [Clostridium estertheticum]WAG42477.1 hypothetical protein LL065_07325 [Clostridium estertheticum]WAG64957.1 hypothetical protein LL037_21230 [Clostridium estertheticum]